MRDIIQQVVTTEAEAKQLLDAARSRAEEQVAEARRRAREQVEQARREADREAAALLDAAETQAATEKASRLASATVEINAGIRPDGALVQELIRAAARCVGGLNSETPLPPDAHPGQRS
ncbi:MAG TPA: hypothetical protein VFV81_01900 [Verrucomicrobiae bacterium]|nr:hypothetical protein [Verrucomicrobiae bacterium]